MRPLERQAMDLEPSWRSAVDPKQPFNTRSAPRIHACLPPVSAKTGTEELQKSGCTASPQITLAWHRIQGNHRFTHTGYSSLVCPETDQMEGPGKNIVIIGAGVNGLTCAYELQKKGHNITIIADAVGHKTTSSVAGALWELPPAVCGYPQHLSLQDITRDQQLSMISYHKFLKLASDMKTGVSVKPVNFYYEFEISNNPIENQKLNAAKAHLVNFRHDTNIIHEHGIDSKIYKDAYMYDAPIIDTDTYLDWLASIVTTHNQSHIVERKIEGSLSESARDLLDEHDAELIVNCSGLGSIELVEDHTVFGARGGLVYVDNSGEYSKQITQAHCTSLSELGLNEGFFIFILPRSENRLVLGGIAEVEKYSVNVTPDSYPPYERILDGCKRFLPDLANAKVIDHYPLRVGIRPFRKKGLRLDYDPEIRTVHNYGHGGAGVLLSWGCARGVCRLIDSLNP